MAPGRLIITPLSVQIALPLDQSPVQSNPNFTIFCTMGGPGFGALLMEAVAIDAASNRFLPNAPLRVNPDPTTGNFQFTFALAPPAALPAAPYDVVVSIASGGLGAINVHVLVQPATAPQNLQVNAATATGITDGGTLVQLTATSGLTGATSVAFGCNGGATGAIQPGGTDMALTVSSPPNDTGPVSVIVTTPNGQSGVTQNNLFTYTCGNCVLGKCFGPAILNSTPRLNALQNWWLCLPRSTGTTWQDVKNGHNATLTSPTAFTTSTLSPVGFGSVSVSTTAPPISVTNTGTFDFGGNDFTLLCWVRWNSFYTSNDWWDGALIGHDAGGGTNSKWIFTYNASPPSMANPLGYALNFFAFNTSSSPNTVVSLGSTALTTSPFAATGLATGIWYRLGVTRAGNNYTFYCNGVAYGGGTASVGVSGFPTVNHALNFGFAEGNILNGFIDDIQIHSRALTATEMGTGVGHDYTDSQAGYYLQNC